MLLILMIMLLEQLSHNLSLVTRIRNSKFTIHSDATTALVLGRYFYFVCVYGHWDTPLLLPLLVCHRFCRTCPQEVYFVGARARVCMRVCVCVCACVRVCVHMCVHVACGVWRVACARLGAVDRISLCVFTYWSPNATLGA